MHDTSLFVTIINCIPVEYKLDPTVSEFYIGNNKVNCITHNSSKTYSSSVLKVGKYKYAYIFRDTTDGEKEIKKFIVNEELLQNALEDI